MGHKHGAVTRGSHNGQAHWSVTTGSRIGQSQRAVTWGNHAGQSHEAIQQTVTRGSHMRQYNGQSQQAVTTGSHTGQSQRTVRTDRATVTDTKVERPEGLARDDTTAVKERHKSRNTRGTGKTRHDSSKRETRKQNQQTNWQETARPDKPSDQLCKLLLVSVAI